MELVLLGLIIAYGAYRVHCALRRPINVGATNRFIADLLVSEAELVERIAPAPTSLAILRDVTPREAATPQRPMTREEYAISNSEGAERLRLAKEDHDRAKLELRRSTQALAALPPR